MLFNLANKEIWVFGGAGYLGRTVVESLALMNASVLCVDRASRAHEFTDALGNPRVRPFSLDKSNPVDSHHAIDSLIDDRGIPFGLVDLTYASTSKSMEELTLEDLQHAHAGGVASTFALVRQIGMEMVKAGHGSIVLFSSMYGKVSPSAAT